MNIAWITLPLIRAFNSQIYLICMVTSNQNEYAANSCQFTEKFVLPSFGFSERRSIRDPLLVWILIKIKVSLDFCSGKKFFWISNLNMNKKEKKINIWMWTWKSLFGFSYQIGNTNTTTITIKLSTDFEHLFLRSLWVKMKKKNVR